MTADSTIEVWRLHPDGCRVAPADPLVGGAAPESARRFCGPYMQANRAGFYVYSPVDVDLTHHASDTWEWSVAGHFWSDAEVVSVDAMCAGVLTPDMGRFLPRNKLFLSGSGHEPACTAQLWTGCIFRTPPGWALWVRSPVNRAEQWPFRVEEAVLETAWLQQDVWLNLHFLEHGALAQLRRDGPPIAQLIPIPYAAYDDWSVREHSLDPADPESARVFSWWRRYNEEKFCPAAGDKDSRIYHRRRRLERQVNRE